MPEIMKSEKCLSCKYCYASCREEPCVECTHCLDISGQEKENAFNLYEEEE